MTAAPTSGETTMATAYILVCGTALAVSGLTLFSGFGLGTLLMPAFTLFFPIEVAVAATAVVHLASNLFKVGLVGRHADWGVVARFAIPGAAAAVAGALLLTSLAGAAPLATYAIGPRSFAVTALKLAVGGLIAVFALLELVPSLEAGMRFQRRHLPLGGALSGFFGGLSGHQGALRSAVLIRLGLDKEAFIGTGVACAVVVDLSRLAAYGATFYGEPFDSVVQAGGVGLVAAATAAAFAGSFAGARLMHKVTMRAVQVIVGLLLLGVAVGLGAGLI